MGKPSEPFLKRYFPYMLLILLLLIPTAVSAGPKKKAQVLSYLQGLPSQTSKKILSGQFIGWCGYMQTSPTLFDAINTASGHYPALMSANYAAYSQCSSILAGSQAPNPYLKAHWAAGGLVEVSWHMRNPATGKFDDGPCNLVDVVTNGTSVNTAWKAEMDRVAEGLQDLQNDGVVVLFRPFPELNTPNAVGDWYMEQDVTQFRNLWIYTYNYLTNTKELNNLIWIYNVVPYRSGWGLSDIAWYPGSSYVDIVSTDVYADSTGVYNQSGGFPYIETYSNLSQLGKPFALAELGQCSGNVTSNCGAKDASMIIKDIKSNYSNAIWWSNWNSFWALPNNYNLPSLMNDPWVINRDDNPSGAAGKIAPVGSGGTKTPVSPVGISVQ